jgi:hypothetical protein
VETRTTDKDLHWLYDDEAISPPPPAYARQPADFGEATPVEQGIPTTTPDVEQADAEAPPPEADLTYADAETQDGDYTEEVDGEVVENPPRLRGISIRWLVPIGIGALLIALTVLMVVLPIFQASATIIITPDKQTLSMEASISTQARQVLNKSLTLSQTVKTTGKAHQNASVSRGLITFYNALPSPQDIPQGTLITGEGGVERCHRSGRLHPRRSLIHQWASNSFSSHHHHRRGSQHPGRRH